MQYSETTSPVFMACHEKKTCQNEKQGSMSMINKAIPRNFVPNGGKKFENDLLVFVFLFVLVPIPENQSIIMIVVSTCFFLGGMGWLSKEQLVALKCTCLAHKSKIKKTSTEKQIVRSLSPLKN